MTPLDFPEGGASVAEAMVLTDWPEGVIRGLATGPLAFDRPGERLSLGVLLGINTIASLGLHGLMQPQHAVGLAVEVAHGAKVGGERVLLVTWRGERPCITWATTMPTTLRQIFLAIPADAIATDLARGIAALRQSSQRRN